MNNTPKPFVPSLFILIGPFIGLLCITLVFHSHIIFYEPLRFLKGLVTPTIIFPMLGYLLLLTPFSYLIGVLPAFIIDQFFKKIFKNKLYQANFSTALIYGCVLGFIWSPILFLLSLYNIEPIKIFLFLQFYLILPTTVICTLLEWKKSPSQ